MDFWKKGKDWGWEHADLSVPNQLCLFFSVQMNMMLSFREECQDCPCPEDIQDLMWEFHQDLMNHCGRQPIRTTNAIIVLPSTGNLTCHTWSIYTHVVFSFFNSGIKIDSDSESENEDDLSIKNHLQGLVDKIIHLKRRMSGLPEEIVNKPGQKHYQSLLLWFVIIYPLDSITC